MTIWLASISRTTLGWVGGLSLAVTTGLFLASERETAIACWVMLGCLLPSLVWVRRSQFLSVKVFVWLAFITQAVTMPLFYLNQEDYRFQSHRPFEFTGVESLQVFVKLGIFLLIFLLVVTLAELAIKLPHHTKPADDPSAQKGAIKEIAGSGGLLRVSQKTSFMSIGLITLVILLMIPLNHWMFKMGIGFTGAEPPRLPYHLSGILTYQAKFVVPALLAYLYMHTSRRSLLLVAVLGLYGIFLGVCTASKGAALSVVLAPIAFSLLERRWAVFGLGLILALVGVSLATTSREFVYVVTAGVSGRVDTSQGLLGTLHDISGRMQWNNPLVILSGIIGRLVSFEGLLLASQVDPASFGGGFAVWLKTLHWDLADLGHEAVHLEAVGYVPPEGFYNATADLYSYAFWMVNGSAMYYLLVAMSAALFLMLQEQAIRKLARKYDIRDTLVSSVVFLLSLSFAVGPGYPFYVHLFLALLLLSRLPRFRGPQAFFRAVGISNPSHRPERINSVSLSLTCP